MKHFPTALLALVLLSVIQNRSVAEDSFIRLLGTFEISGESTDLSGLQQELVPDSGTSADEIPTGRTFYNNMLGGVSALTWSGTKDVYWMLPDRGPLDGAVDWSCRVHKVRVSVNPNSAQPMEAELLATVLLRDRRGNPYTGNATAFEATDTQSYRLDPEGIRVGKNGNLFISDEYGPHLIEFTPDGKFVREFSLPDHYLVADPDVSKTTENPKNVSGRSTNRGMEGLAISEDGKRLFGLMQSPLLQDAHRETPTAKPMGLNCRIPSFDNQGECQNEFVYQLENESYKLNEILNCGESRFVVIERDGELGNAAAFKKLMLVSTKGASDVSSVDQLPRKELPQHIQPVSKVELIDLLDPKWGLVGDNFPEKIESLAFGPDIDNENRLLLVASDNDFVPDQDTVIYAFAVAKSALR